MGSEYFGIQVSTKSRPAPSQLISVPLLNILETPDSEAALFTDHYQ